MLAGYHGRTPPTHSPLQVVGHIVVIILCRKNKSTESVATISTNSSTSQAQLQFSTSDR